MVSPGRDGSPGRRRRQIDEFGFRHGRGGGRIEQTVPAGRLTEEHGTGTGLSICRLRSSKSHGGPHLGERRRRRAGRHVAFDLPPPVHLPEPSASRRPQRLQRSSSPVRTGLEPLGRSRLVRPRHTMCRWRAGAGDGIGCVTEAQTLEGEDARMADKVLVFYGSYRTERVGIRMATFATAELRARGANAELIDARDFDLRSWTGCTRSSPQGPRRRRWPTWPPGSAPRTPTSLSWGSTTGARNPIEEPHRPFPGGMVLAAAAIVTIHPSPVRARASSAWHHHPVRDGIVLSPAPRGRADRRDLRRPGHPLATRAVRRGGLRPLADDLRGGPPPPATSA